MGIGRTCACIAVHTDRTQFVCRADQLCWWVGQCKLSTQHNMHFPFAGSSSQLACHVAPQVIAAQTTGTTGRLRLKVAGGAAGLISYAGNWVGQGSSLGAIFTGRSLFDYGAFPSSAAAWASWPATYMAASSYKYYGRGETILRTLQPTGGVQGQVPAGGALPD